MKGQGRMRFGDIAIKRPPASNRGPFWIGAPRDGFTKFCAVTLQQQIALDDVSDSEAKAMVRRQDLLSALEGVRQAKQVGAILRANVVGN